MAQLLTKSELVSRLQLISQEVMSKIDARPTKDVVNKSLSKLNQKIMTAIEERVQSLNQKFI